MSPNKLHTLSGADLRSLYIKNIQIIDNFISDEEINLVNQSIWRTENEDWAWHSDGGKVQTHRVLQSSFASGMINHLLTPLVSGLIGRRLEVFVEPYIRIYSQGSSLEYHIDGEGDDASGPIPLQMYSDDYRKCAAMIEYAANIYLSSDFEGGEIYFHHLNHSVKPRAGQLIIFPAGSEYAHSVGKIESGERRALVIFYTTDKLRDLHRKITQR